jgi:hypothetical protein
VRKGALSKAVAKIRFTKAIEGRVLLTATAWHCGSAWTSWNDATKRSTDELPVSGGSVTINAPMNPAIRIDSGEVAGQLLEQGVNNVSNVTNH